jgi:pilus assembly protein CpaB
MRPRIVVLAIIALVLALVTAHYVRRSLEHAHHQVAVVQVVPKTYVLVTSHELASGALISAADLNWQSWPDSNLNKDYALQGRDNMQTFVGAVVRQHIVAGTPITIGMLIKPGEGGFLAAVLAPGMRAIAVPLTAVSDEGGLVLPGDHVDLILAHSVVPVSGIDTKPRFLAETVALNIRVLAIDDSINDQDKKPLLGRTATLEVTPNQAERVEVAEQIGTLSLALRSVATSPDTTINAALGSRTWDNDVSSVIRRGEYRAGGATNTSTVTVLRGGSSSTASGTNQANTSPPAVPGGT